MMPLCDVCIEIEKNERKQRLTEQAQVAGESGRTVSPTQANNSAPKASRFSSALRTCAVIDLIVGIIGAIGVLIILKGTASSKAEIFFIVWVVVALQGFFFFVLFNVIAEMAESLQAILHKLSERS
jgi:beta-lactamase regulating signal transducer with metallopeptidase domain